MKTKIITKLHAMIQAINDESSVIRISSDVDCVSIITTDNTLKGLHDLVNELKDPCDHAEEIKNLLIENARQEMEIKRLEKDRDNYIGMLIDVSKLIPKHRVSKLNIDELNALIDNIRSLAEIPKNVKDDFLGL